MVTLAVEGIDLFKIADRSISGWIPSFKAGVDSPVRQPFCNQLEERLLLWFEYTPPGELWRHGAEVCYDLPTANPQARAIHHR